MPSREQKRILAIGIENLPPPIKSMSWLGAAADRPNISDYDIVFVDYSTYPHNFLKLLPNADREEYFHKINTIFNDQKFAEILSGRVCLFIFIDRGAPLQWLANFVDVSIMEDTGVMRTVVQSKWQKYFDLLDEWHLGFFVNPVKDDLRSVKCNYKVLAHTKAGLPIGAQIEGVTVYRRQSKFTSWQDKTFIPAAVFLLHTLRRQSREGVLHILGNILEIPLTQKEPEWSKRIDLEKGKAIKTEIKQLEEAKEEIETQIATKTKELEELYEFKKLLWATDRELEGIICRFFEELLGIAISGPTKSEEDGVFELRDCVYVVEIKSGKRRGARFEELSKLITRMETILKRHPDKKIKGLFIMNHFAELPVSERKAPFPDNVKKTAEVNEVKLITTAELFEIARGIIDGKMERNEAIQKVLDLK